MYFHVNHRDFPGNQALKVSKTYFVYIMTNKWNQVLYTGVTCELVTRVFQHREKQIDGFTSRYNVEKLVYFEVLTSSEAAIKRERQIKGGSRENGNCTQEAFR